MPIVDEIITTLTMRVSPESKRAVEQMMRDAKKVKTAMDSAATATNRVPANQRPRTPDQIVKSVNADPLINETRARKRNTDQAVKEVKKVKTAQDEVAKSTKNSAGETEKANASLIKRLQLLGTAGKKTTSEFSTSLKSLNLAIPLVGLTIGAVVTKLAGMTTGVATSATAVKRLGESLAIPAKTFQNLQAAGKLVSSNPNELVDIAAIVQRMGVYDDVINGMQNLADNLNAVTQKNAMLAGGQIGLNAEAVRVLRAAHGGGIKRLLERANAIKAAIPPGQQKSFDDFTTALAEASLAISNFKRSFAAKTIPFATDFLKTAPLIIKDVVHFARLGGGLVESIEKEVKNLFTFKRGDQQSANIPASTVAAANVSNNSSSNTNNAVINVHGQTDPTATAHAIRKRNIFGNTPLGTAQARFNSGVSR